MPAFYGGKGRDEEEKGNGRGCAPKGRHVLGPLSGGFIAFSQEGILGEVIGEARSRIFSSCFFKTSGPGSPPIGQCQDKDHVCYKYRFRGFILQTSWTRR